MAAYPNPNTTQPAVAAYLSSDARVPLTPNEIGQQPNAGLPGCAFVRGRGRIRVTPNDNLTPTPKP